MWDPVQKGCKAKEIKGRKSSHTLCKVEELRREMV